MRKISLLFILILLTGLCGCAASGQPPQVMATTKPVYDFTVRLCAGTDISVGLLVNESVSCLHDYSLSVDQVRNAECADVIVISGAGLESFMEDLLGNHSTVIDSSANISLLECEESHDHDHGHDHGHGHDADPHIWLSPEIAKQMVRNICSGLCLSYPAHADTFYSNAAELDAELDALQAYGTQALQGLACRELVTFHDGFSYLAHAFDLTIAAAIEEESGSEASAKTLIQLIELVRTHQIPAVFTETNGSTSAAHILSAELHVPIFSLDMGMSGDYFTIMYHNIDTIKEALG